jgi:hypothetical protein
MHTHISTEINSFISSLPEGSRPPPPKGSGPPPPKGSGPPPRERGKLH